MIIAPAMLSNRRASLPEQVVASGDLLFAITEGQHVRAAIAVAFQARKQPREVHRAFARQQVLFESAPIVGYQDKADATDAELVEERVEVAWQQVHVISGEAPLQRR